MSSTPNMEEFFKDMFGSSSNQSSVKILGSLMVGNVAVAQIRIVLKDRTAVVSRNKKLNEPSAPFVMMWATALLAKKLPNIFNGGILMKTAGGDARILASNDTLFVNGECLGMSALDAIATFEKKEVGVYLEHLRSFFDTLKD